MEQKVVAGRLHAITVGHTFFNHKVAGQTFFAGGSQRQATMVGLDSATGNQGIGAFGISICDKKFQLAGFVATACKTKHIVSFYPNVRST